jgi:hypothetical protein
MGRSSRWPALLQKSGEGWANPGAIAPEKRPINVGVYPRFHRGAAPRGAVAIGPAPMQRRAGRTGARGVGHRAPHGDGPGAGSSSPVERSNGADRGNGARRSRDAPTGRATGSGAGV